MEYIGFNTRLKNSLRSIAIIICFFILWSLSTVKWKTGTDWDSYYDVFYYFSDIYRGYFEPGFLIIVSTIRSFTSNYTIYLGIFSFLCLALKFSFFVRYHKETIFTIILLFYCYYFGDIFAVRQNLAISITLVSTGFIIKKRPILFAISVGLASSIHFTSILYILAYFIYWSHLKDRTIYILTGISILFGLLGGGEKLLSLILQVIGINGYAGEKINQYLNASGTDTINTNNNPLLIYILGLIKRCLFIPIFFWIKNRCYQNSSNIKGYLNLYMFGNIIYFLFAKDLSIFARASVPFLFFEIFLICFTLSYFKFAPKNFILIFLIIMVVSASRFNALINSYYNLYVPYNSIFDNRINRVLE
ncbi:EpsG family protein [Pedobacter sp. MR2016-24]|uniref:EpsG family protein n=1 Tax=Pedobacter sp. MR2016-24 TaxID=2994466 RepID=UPI003A4D67CA